jgi:hypothetical protein
MGEGATHKEAPAVRRGLPLPSVPGGDRGIRTPGLRDANAALSQLSYIPVPDVSYSQRSP